MGLPDLTESSPNVYEYANKANVPVRLVRKMRPDRRSFVAFVVNKPAGQHWGVLVVDSKDPTLDQKRIEEEYDGYKAILQRIVDVL